MNKLQKVQVLQPQTGDTIRNFTNPICKQTFYSLPKIYGKKKKKSRMQTSPPQKPKQTDQQSRVKPRRHNSSYQIPSLSKSRKSNNQSKLLGITTHVSGCSRKNCSCHISQQLSGQKTRKKFLSTYTRQMLLPQIRKFDLQDLQTQHKVSLQGIATKTNFRPSGLDQIIEQNQKIRSQHESPTDQKNAQLGKKQLIKQHKSMNIPKPNLQAMKNRYKVKPKINNARFEIEQQSDEQKMTDEDHQKNESKNTHKIQRNESARYKTEPNVSQSPKSANSKSFSTFLINGPKRQNTNFYELNISQKSMEKKLLHRKPSQLSNGLFRIPEEEEYADYLRGYNNVGQNFNIKKIARRPNFKVEKSQKGVYFGQFDNEFRKHGQGISISERQIFQGRYERDVKTCGCQRNIDGVYIGQFKNGKRAGHGVFRWNNGEIFEGQWQNGMKNGFGTWKSPKGDYYEGQWVQNRQHGQGIFRHRTSTYKGEFKNFLKDGYGTEDFINGDRYQGEYKQGKPHGKGRYEWHKGSFYEGEFNSGMRQGRGKWVDEDGITYQGYFKSDFKHGFGKQTSKNGVIFEGQFEQGKRVINRTTKQASNSESQS